MTKTKELVYLGIPHQGGIILKETEIDLVELKEIIVDETLLEFLSKNK